MKKISMILVVLAMMLTMTQCKKNEATDQNKTVTITLDVKSNNGAKVDVNPSTGTVDFETGDKVYVGSGGKYVGFLTHNGTNFVGNITNPTEGQPLQFYFLGNVTPQETLSAGTTEECSVIISDQTEHLPVISCAPSFENYVSGVTAYTGHLLNKCALVKFNVTTPSNSPICITGMKNKVTVDFTQNTMTPNMDGEGIIMLPAGNGENVEKWAILLPQEALEEGEEGSSYSRDGNYEGTRPEIPTLTENGYLAEGLHATVNMRVVIEGAVNSLFSVSETKQVYFSKGNLQYQASTNTWRFAENQWNYVGGIDNYSGIEYGNTYYDEIKCDNSYISPTYSGWIDLFGWGTSGWNNGNVYYQPYDFQNNGVVNHGNGYGPTDGTEYMYDLTDAYCEADWGVHNPIINGGNQRNRWRTLTNMEWNYIVYYRNTVSGIRYAMACVNNTNGVILLPDDWSSAVFVLNHTNENNVSFNVNVISLSHWEYLEANGAVFLPAAGLRLAQNDIRHNIGGYWTITHASTFGANVLYFVDKLFDNNVYSERQFGNSVRLVHDY